MSKTSIISHQHHLYVSIALQPWEPEPIFCNALQWDSISTDCWGNSSLLLATEDTGVIFMNEGLSVPIIDAAARVQQLAALEHFGLFLARVDKGQ